MPATISTQGTWCLKSDVSTAITSGAAITVANNNVTLDCNDFKLGGLGGGAGTTAEGVRADARTGLTVRHCNIRGFSTGIHFNGGGNHLVEDNGFNANTFEGIYAKSVDGLIIRNNILTDTGGSTSISYTTAIDIYTPGSGVIIEGNVVTGVTGAAVPLYGTTYGIFNGTVGAVIANNRVTGVLAPGTYAAYGLDVIGSYGKVVGNTVDNISSGSGARVGIVCGGGMTSVAKDNMTSRTTTALNLCIDGGGNIDSP